MEGKKISPLYKFIKRVVRRIYPVIRVEGTENLPDGAAVIVGNHAQMNGPIACELYVPGEHSIWCASQMMAWKEVHGYAYQDFWSQKPRGVRWLYRIASYLITPLSVLLFNNANTIPVYRDRRILTTFRETTKKLCAGGRVVIFPEQDAPHNHIVYDFQDHFVDVARLYYKKTGKPLSFVPLYIAPKRKTMIFGRPVCFDPDAPIVQERRRICDTMMTEITDMACAMPRHIVVPYRNIPKKDYPFNTPGEVDIHEETRG